MQYSASTTVMLVAAAWVWFCADALGWSQEIPRSSSAIMPAAEDRLIAEPSAAFVASEQNSQTTSDSSTDPPQPKTTFRLRGRVDTDVIGTLQSPANEATFGDLGNVVGLRRARIGVEGDLKIGGRYITEIDLASGEVVVRDMFVGLGESQVAGEWRGGHYREPFSLEMATGANYFAFLERSAINVLDPARNWGLGLFRSGLNDSGTLAFGVFQSGTDPNDFEARDGSAVGLTGKWTSAPLYEEDGRRLLHLGVAASERLPEHGVIIINQQTQSTLLDLGDAATSPFLPVIRVPATSQELLNLQCATANGSFWTQAEWYGSWIDQKDGGTVFFHGFHADCGLFLTGEHRAYQVASGAFGPIRVHRPLVRCCANQDRPAGWGAWELTARFAYLDFQDADTPLGPDGQFAGIQLPESTFGVNWYLADHMRLMFNYSYAVPDEPNVGTSVANLFAVRLGVFW